MSSWLSIIDLLIKHSILISELRLKFLSTEIKWHHHNSCSIDSMGKSFVPAKTKISTASSGDFLTKSRTDVYCVLQFRSYFLWRSLNQCLISSSQGSLHTWKHTTMFKFKYFGNVLQSNMKQGRKPRVQKSQVFFFKSDLNKGS